VRRPRGRGQLRVDASALRRALGGRDELLEAMAAKAKGRPGVNAARIWAFLTTSLYQSGDLPLLATREALQNSADAIRAAVRARKLRAGEGRFEVSWDAERRALTWTDNGVGMDTRTILDKFLSLGDSGKAEAGSSDEAAGGFGVAKAVILGASETFTWRLHTRDNLAVSQGPRAEVEVFDAPHRDGTQLTIFGVSPRFDETWDYARQAHVPLLDRLRELLAANDLHGIALVLDGAEVAPMFSRRGGSRVSVEGSWGEGTTASIKAYRRSPGDRRGAYYVRLGGLLQFRVPAQRGDLKADIVIDLATAVRPGEAGYPLNAARDALQDAARWAFSDLVEQVERENESVGRSLEDEVFDPDSDDERERSGAAELGELAAAAFRDPAFQRALAEAAGGIVDFYAERAKAPSVEAPIASLAPPGTRGLPAGAPPELPPGLRAASVDPDTASPTELQRLLEAAEVVTPEVRSALDRAASGALDGWGVKALSEAIDRAADAALRPGSGGLLQAAAVAVRGQAVLDALTPSWARALDAPVRRNPFGRLAGLRISKRRYDRRRAARFREGFQRWIPHLTAWDSTLRLIAGEARIRRRFKPGFVLDDELLGLTTSTSVGAIIIHIHPDRLEQVIRAHRTRPLAIAAYLHGVACHELTHADGRMGQGHSEEFVAAREDLGHATGHLLPAIAALVASVLRLPVRPTDEQRRIARLERELERVRAGAKGRREENARLQDALQRARGDLADAERRSAEARAACGRACACRRAGRVLDAAASVLLARPPEGVDAGDIETFLSRHRQQLVGLVEAALLGRGA
jgi:hypothetical protein